MMTGVNVEELVGDGERVCGVRATHEGRTIFVKANKGVLIGVFAFAMLMIGYDDTWGYRGRPVWIVTARSYPAVDTFSRELVPLIAAKREQLRSAEEARDAAAGKAAKGQ